MIQEILQQIHPIKRPKILSFSTHEAYQENLAETNADFYLWGSKPEHPIRTKSWNTTFRPVPKNHFILQGQRWLDQIPVWLSPNLLLAQTLAGHFQIAKALQQRYAVPIVRLEHTLPHPNTPKTQLQELKKNFSGNINIFITAYNRSAWNFNEQEGIVIHHGINTEVLKPLGLERKLHILTVANEYPQRRDVLGFDQYLRVTKGLNCFPVGDSPGFSKPAANTQELVKFYNESRIFLNTANSSPIPMSMLESAACGSAIVSCPSPGGSEFFTHGKDILFAKDDKEMRGYLEDLLLDEVLATKLGRAARQTILEKCSLMRFTNQWNEVFQLALSQ